MKMLGRVSALTKGTKIGTVAESPGGTFSNPSVYCFDGAELPENCKRLFHDAATASESTVYTLSSDCYSGPNQTNPQFCN